MNEQDNIITVAGVERTFALYERKVAALRAALPELRAVLLIDADDPSGDGVYSLPALLSAGRCRRCR